MHPELNDFIMVLCVVFKERQQHLTFLCRKNEVQMIFEVFGKNIKSLIFYSMKNYKIHIHFDVTHFEDCMQGIMHLITEMKPQR